MMFKQQKAKTYGKDKIKDLTGYWSLSKKYDGHQIFIEKRGKEVKFFTSNHKQFNIEYLAAQLRILEDDFILIGEYLYDCQGKLGDRATSSKVTTFRTNFNKSLKNDIIDERKSLVKIFDCIPIIKGLLRTDYTYAERRTYLHVVSGIKTTGGNLQVTKGHYVPLEEALELVDSWTSEGWEGGMLIRAEEEYYPGKRVHHAVKLKGRLTADLKCVGVTEGEGKYLGMVGSLVLTDSNNITVSVGSGLNDKQRCMNPNSFMGKVIEIQYERIDKTYIQPVFIGIRDDKELKDID